MGEGQQKVWSKQVCEDLEYGSGCTNEVYLPAQGCNGTDFGYVKIDGYGIEGKAAPGCAYEIKYKCHSDDYDKPPCEDKWPAKKCKKSKKKCGKKSVKEMCPMTCGACDDEDDHDD